jgi:hypothetical protein
LCGANNIRLREREREKKREKVRPSQLRSAGLIDFEFGPASWLELLLASFLGFKQV